jgi:hypothetical protein
MVPSALTWIHPLDTSILWMYATVSFCLEAELVLKKEKGYIIIFKSDRCMDGWLLRGIRSPLLLGFIT